MFRGTFEHNARLTLSPLWLESRRLSRLGSLARAGCSRNAGCSRALRRGLYVFDVDGAVHCKMPTNQMRTVA